MADGRSALAGLGIKQFPCGTREEVEQAGLDPVKVACCAKPIKDEVRGCAVWGSCRFDHKGMGGFKGQGPRYIGYRIIDPATGDLGTNQDVHTCFAFVHGLQKRADYGAAARRESGGARGEVIRVFAQEGDTIETRYDLPINGKGEVVNVMPEMVETLTANAIKFSLLPGEVAIGRKMFELKRTVPRFPRLNEAGGESFAQRVAMMDMEVDQEARERIDYAASPPAIEEDKPSAKGGARNPWGRAGKPKEADATA